MRKYTLRNTAIAIGLLFIGFAASAQYVAEPQNTPAEWSKPYPPFKIVGNLYYVGTDDLACYLVVTQQGNILINTGLANSLPLIKANIETLGFKFADVRVLLTTQAHYDHMGAMAAIKKLTGAQMLVDYKDSDVVADGGKSDYALGGPNSVYEPLRVDRVLHNGDTIKLCEMQIVMLHHPGHTKGSCSFLFDVKDGSSQYKVLIANMPTIVTDKKLSEIIAYPDIIKDYKYTFDAMKTLSFDIWLSSHASQFGLQNKNKVGDAYNPAAFIDKKGYQSAISHLQDEFERKLNGK